MIRRTRRHQAVKRMGLRKIIEDVGAALLSGLCPELYWKLPMWPGMDSAKQNYLTGMFIGKLDVWYGSMEEWLNAA